MQRAATRGPRGGAALVALDERTADGAVLIDDFDEELDDGPGMQRKLVLLDELVSDYDEDGDPAVRRCPYEA